jgi:hypothetical protein
VVYWCGCGVEWGTVQPLGEVGGEEGWREKWPWAGLGLNC